MTRFSLINAHRDNGDGTVYGSWMQDHHGTLETAQKRADETAAANSNRISVVVCEPVSGTTPILDGPKNHKKAKAA